MSAAPRVRTDLPAVVEQATEKGKPSTSEDTKACPEVFYDEATKEYLLPIKEGWLRINETSCRRHLKANGISPSKPDDALISPLDVTLNYIQVSNNVCYAGPLAGHKAGLYTDSGARVLVTSSPKLIEAKKGEWKTFRSFIERMLDGPDCKQSPYLFGWLKVALDNLKNGGGTPGQALVIAGGAGCGKSLLQNIITEILGGRQAKPYQYMIGETTFNGDLFGAEHLMVEDEAASSDLRIRRRFGAEIKSFTVNEMVRYHPKGKAAISLRPLWRLSITLNDEPENLMVLPPLDESLEDKVILLHAVWQPLPTNTLAERKAFREKLTSELPAFIDWLESWKIPQELVSPRFGIKHYHHPELISAIQQLTPEMKLWGMIETELFTSGDEWKGTSLELALKLKSDCSSVKSEAKQLLAFYNTCGTYLGRLANSMPECVIEDRKSAKRRDWIIRKPRT